MYRNCVYNNRTKSIHLWTWDSNGRRIKEELDFSPYIYLENKIGDEKSIFGTSLKKREFNTQWDRSKFIKESGIKRIFENLPPYQQFLVDNYYHNNTDDDFSKNDLKIMYFDIECPAFDKFPEPDDADVVINLLTCFDSETKMYTMFGLKPYCSDRTDVNYYHCKSEEDLLKRFIGYFTSDYPDCLVGYNSAYFDVPYLINRITNVLGDEWANELSPIGRIYQKTIKDGKFGQPTSIYVIEGISSLDYFVIYQKFSMNPLESYSLDNVAEHELGENKVSYEGSLWDLAKNDWKTYCDYNLVDVELLVKLENELKYLDLLRFLSYFGLCNMENAVNTVPVINGAVAIRARHRGERIPTFIRPHNEEKIPGGHVAEPRIGFADNIVSFDANSLYPSVMISLNMSPETKIGSYEVIDDVYHIKHVSGKTFELDKKAFDKFIETEKIGRSDCNILFSQKKKGLMPEFLDSLYSKRKELKAKMIKYEKTLEKNRSKLDEDQIKKIEILIKRLDTYQHAYKITLNSTYGYCANKFAPLGDKEIGASVTLTGQAAIKTSVGLYYDFIKSKIPDITERELEQAYIYSDTDSDYLSLGWVNKLGISIKDENGVTDEFYSICDEIESHLNEGMTRWARKDLWSDDPRFVFKREAICDGGIFLGKKYYVIHLLDNEGVKCSKYKYKGVDVVKSTMPNFIKPYIKNIIETMISTKSKAKCKTILDEVYNQMVEMGPDKVYINTKVNKLTEWSNKCQGYSTASRMPYHVKASYFHNNLINDLNLDGRYAKIRDTEKVRIVYLKKPNKFGIENVAFKGKFPKEFLENFEVDYKIMLDRLLFSPIERFYTAVGWYLRKPTEEVRVELEDFLSDE